MAVPRAAIVGRRRTAGRAATVRGRSTASSGPALSPPGSHSRCGIDRPVARFDAAIRPGTPPWAVRLCAGAPLPAFLGLAGALDAVVGLAGTTPASLVATAAVAYWASLSDGDVAIVLDPSAVIGAGTFVATGRSRAAGLASLLVTLAATAVVSLAFLR